MVGAVSGAILGIDLGGVIGTDIGSASGSVRASAHRSGIGFLIRVWLHRRNLRNILTGITSNWRSFKPKNAE
jgi:hypothetical protein